MSALWPFPRMGNASSNRKSEARKGLVQSS